MTDRRRSLPDSLLTRPIATIRDLGGRVTICANTMLIVLWEFLRVAGLSGFSSLSFRLLSSPAPCFPVASPSPVDLIGPDVSHSSLATGLVTVTCGVPRSWSSSPANVYLLRPMIRPLEHRSTFVSICRKMSRPKTLLYSTSNDVTKNSWVYTRFPNLNSMSWVPMPFSFVPSIPPRGQIRGFNFRLTYTRFHKT